MYQTTLKKHIQFSGIGLHSGQNVRCTLRPARENTGILFHIHTDNCIKTIDPTPECVAATGLATTLSDGDVKVATVEHLLAALRGLEIDNVHIDVYGTEIPVLDGSALEYIEKIQLAGIERQNARKRYLRVTNAFSVGDNQKFVKVEPCDEFIVDYTIDFPHKAIGRQRLTLTITPENFARIAKARTFGFLRDVEAMRAHGLALGGGLENAIVLDEEGVLNEEGLRYRDEFVRHKLLDFIGDMGVLSHSPLGHFTVYCSGHGLNNQFARLLKQSNSIEVVTNNAKNYSYIPNRNTERALAAS